MKTIDALEAFHAASPDAAMAYLRTVDPWEERPRSDYAALGQELLASAEPAFRDLALTALPLQPWASNLPRLVMGALVRSPCPSDFDCLPQKLRTTWGAEVYRQLKSFSSHQSDCLEGVARRLFSATSPGDAGMAQAWSDRLVECVVGEASSDDEDLVRTKARAILFRAALCCPHASLYVAQSLLQWAGSNSRMMGLTFESGHLDALAVFIEEAPVPVTFVMSLLPKWQDMLSAAVAGAREPSVSRRQHDESDPLDFETVEAPARALTESLGTPAGKSGLTRLALATEKFWSTVLHDTDKERFAPFRRQTISRWAIAAEWLDERWTSALCREPVSKRELASLLFCVSHSYARARLAAGVEEGVHCAADAKVLLSHALGQARRGGWTPGMGFQPDVLSVLRENGWETALPFSFFGKSKKAAASSALLPEEVIFQDEWSALVLAANLPDAPEPRRPRL